MNANGACDLRLRGAILAGGQDATIDIAVGQVAALRSPGEALPPLPGRSTSPEPLCCRA